MSIEFGRPPDRVRYGEPEVVGEEQEQVVDVPGVFLAAPPRTLKVRTQTVTLWKRKRIEEWCEDGQTFAKWTWAMTEADRWAAGLPPADDAYDRWPRGTQYSAAARRLFPDLP